VQAGVAGLEQIIEIKLTPEEEAALKKSAEAVKELCAVIGASPSNSACNDVANHVAAANSPIAAKSTGNSTSSSARSLLGSARVMLIAWSPMRSRSPLILITDEDEPQIDGHGLLLGEQLVGHLVQLALRSVDGSLVLLDEFAQALVAL
jgi:hypothetical protein